MKKSFFAVLLVLLAVLCFTACSSDNVIVLRSSGPLTGDYSVYGIATNKGMQLAVEEINANGGVTIDGVQYKLDYKMYDDTGDGTKAKSSFLQDAKKVDVWVGSVTSGAADSVATEAAKVNVPMITPSGTADNLTVGANNNRADRSNVFRTCYNDSLQGIVMANFAKELEAKKVAVLVNTTSTYSTGLRDSFVQKAGELKAYDYATVVDYTEDTTDFTSVVSQVVEAAVDCVFIPDYYSKASSIVKQLRDAGYTGKFLGVDGWDGILDVIGEDLAKLADCYFCNHYSADSESQKVQDFIKAYKEANNDEVPNAFATLGYDAIQIAVQAIKQAGALDSAKIIEALTNGTFDCVTGNIKFDENGNPQKEVVILTFGTEGKGSHKFYATGSTK